MHLTKKCRSACTYIFRLLAGKAGKYPQQTKLLHTVVTLGVANSIRLPTAERQVGFTAVEQPTLTIGIALF